MNPLTHGSGIWLWQLKKCGPKPIRLIEAMRPSRVLIKVADGSRKFRQNVGRAGSEFTRQCRDLGVQTVGWNFIYDKSPVQQVDVALEQVDRLKLSGLVLNAERAFVDGDDWDEGALGRALDRATQKAPFVGLSSYRRPQYFPDFPWHVVSRYPEVVCMNQVYFLHAMKQAEARVKQSTEEWSALGNPVVTSLGAWKGKNTPAGMKGGVQSVLKLSREGRCLPSFDWWSLEHLRACPENARTAALLNQAHSSLEIEASNPEPILKTPWFQKAALMRLGHYYGRLAGGWDHKARSALREFQDGSRHYKGKVDGIWGKKTRKAVVREFKDAQ